MRQLVGEIGAGMKRTFLAVIAVTAFAGPALAQAEPEPVPQWNGPYVLSAPGLFLSGEEDALAQASIATRMNGVDNAIAGFLGGTSIQSGTWVFGVEGDVGWSGSAATADTLETNEVLPPGFDDATHLRGRAGIASGDSLFYVAGGLAIADAPVADARGGSELDKGWTLGFGVEHNFSDTSFGRIEYLHDDYGAKDSCSGSGCDDNASVTAQILRAVFGLKF